MIRKNRKALLRRHLRDYVDDSPQALVFTGPSDGHPPLRRNSFRKLVGWEAAVAAVGAPGLHFHDLRHTGNVESARAGVSTRDLMARMGHESPRAALRYQHATAAADRTIADSLSDSLRKVAKEAKKAKKKTRAADAGAPAAQRTSTDGVGRRESA